MKAEMAIISGAGFNLGGIVDEAVTPYGNLKVRFTRLKGRMVVFIPRHGQEQRPPHKVNYRAMILVARETGANRIFSTNSVGSMSYHPVGCFFLSFDFVEFTKARVSTFYEDKAVHVDMSNPPPCPDLRSRIKEALKSLEIHEGAYVCTKGPHLEPTAQIRMLRQFGDVVGMTGYPEVVRTPG